MTKLQNYKQSKIFRDERRLSARDQNTVHKRHALFLMSILFLVPILAVYQVCQF